jgi:hypothetical protein
VNKLIKLFVVSIVLIISTHACAMDLAKAKEIAQVYETNCRILGVDPSISLSKKVELAYTNKLVQEGNGNEESNKFFARASDFVCITIERIEKAKQKRSYEYLEEVEKGWFADIILVVESDTKKDKTRNPEVTDGVYEPIIRAYYKTPQYKYSRIFAAALLGITAVAVTGYYAWKNFPSM